MAPRSLVVTPYQNDTTSLMDPRASKYQNFNLTFPDPRYSNKGLIILEEIRYHRNCTTVENLKQ